MSNILTPKDEQELAEIIAQHAADKSGLRIQAGGTRLGLGNIVKAATTLSLQALSGVNLYDAGALTLVAKAGTSYAEIETLLASENQRLAFEPMDHSSIFSTNGKPTIGAIAAGNISGSRRIQSGACRDALIGVRLVNGRGEIIKNGGRVMKNVTGLDLVKLMAGAFGTLGVLTEVAFKTLPIPERQATLVVENTDIAQAVNTMSTGLCSPFEVTGAAYSPDKKLTYLRVEGFDTQVDYRLKKLTDLVGNDGLIEGQNHKDLWRSLRNVESFGGSNKPLWKLSVKPSDAIEIANILTQQAEAELQFDWGGGLIWAQMPDVNNANQDIVRSAIAKLGGHATLVRATDETKVNIFAFQPQAAGVAKLSAAIKHKFDPQNILNSGLMG